MIIWIDALADIFSDDKDITVVTVNKDGEASSKHASSISKVSAVINTPPTKNIFSHIMERSTNIFSTNKSCNNDYGNVRRFYLEMINATKISILWSALRSLFTKYHQLFGQLVFSG
jgi:hypothetical protein